MCDPVISGGAAIAGAALINSEAAEPVRNYIVDLYDALNVMMPEPQPYGSFHLTAISIVLVLTVLLSYLLRNASPRLMRFVIAGFWLVMIVSELLDQFVVCTTVVDGVLVFDYSWGRFPYQLCATGLWILPLIFLLPECRGRDWMMVYMGLYSFFGGLLVCVVPTTVFSELLIINLHTMIQHGSQVIFGVMMLVYNRRKLSIRSFLGASLIFLILVAIAVGANEVFYHLLRAFGDDAKFNMFYISPYFNSGMPVFSVVFELVPWGVFLAMYIVGFALIAFLIYFIAILSIHVAEGIRYKRMSKAEAEEKPEAL